MHIWLWIIWNDLKFDKDPDAGNVMAQRLIFNPLV